MSHYWLDRFNCARKFFSARRVVTGVVVVVLVILAVSSYCGWQVLQTVDHAEKALHAVYLMARVTEDYLVEHDGQWPTSWRDLQSTPPREGGMFWWPRDVEVIQRYIDFEFGKSTQELLREESDDFRAISPIGPCYEGYHEAFVPLLRTMRETNVRQGQK
jgi:hypothetical protein